MDKGAIISDCGAFRYRLWRRWADSQPLVFVMLNPSTVLVSADSRGWCTHCGCGNDAAGYAHAPLCQRPRSVPASSNDQGEKR